MPEYVIRLAPGESEIPYEMDGADWPGPKGDEPECLCARVDGTHASACPRAIPSRGFQFLGPREG